jgi:hypothetical protein
MLNFGQVWEAVFLMALKLENTFGEKLDLSSTISVQWESPEVRNQLLETQIATTYKTLEVPIQEVWATMGFTPDQIEAFTMISREQKAAEIAQIASTIIQGMKNQPTPNEQPQPQGQQNL